MGEFIKFIATKIAKLLTSDRHLEIFLPLINVLELSQIIFSVFITEKKELLNYEEFQVAKFVVNGISVETLTMSHL